MLALSAQLPGIHVIEDAFAAISFAAFHPFESRMRYVVFLGGRAGFVFHFRQGFWYRLIVDAKIYQQRLAHGSSNVNPDGASKNVR